MQFTIKKDPFNYLLAKLIIGELFRRYCSILRAKHILKIFPVTHMAKMDSSSLAGIMFKIKVNTEIFPFHKTKTI